MLESLSASYTEVFPFLRAEARHFHSSPDEKLKRELGEKCRCMLIEKYTHFTGNQITGLACVCPLEKTIFEAHARASARALVVVAILASWQALSGLFLNVRGL
jgi:hypothetical protein